MATPDLTLVSEATLPAHLATTLTNAKGYADTKKNEAISAASSDATTKANTAKDEAIADATTKYGGLPDRVETLEADKWMKPPMPGTADFDDYTTPGSYPVPTSGGKTNIPFPVSGNLDVIPMGNILTQTYTTAEQPPRTVNRRLNAGVFGTWRMGSIFAPIPVGGTDFDDIVEVGIYPISSGSHPNQPFPNTGTLEVLPLGSNLLHRFTTNELVPRSTSRRKTSTAWQAWTTNPTAAEITALDQRVTAIENAPPASGGDSPTKYGHTVRLARAKQLVGVRSSSRTQVALICDHGTVKFRDLIFPKLQALGLTCTLALNSQKMPGGAMHDPALEVDTWDQVKTWQTAGIEMANHGRTHQDTDSMATLYDEIVTGHEELETALGKPVHSWVQPAASGDLGKWFGFDDGIRWDSWANTDAGRMILDRHAVATGTIYPIGTYQLTGEPPIGMQGHWFDRDDQIEPLKTKIVAAEAEKSGILLRLHPQYIGGQNTIGAIDGFLEWLAAEKAAGRVDVVTLTQWALTRIEA